ncbi:MAG: ankyrin repeat domain-containing protein [Desulfomonilaceae bacterium]
MKSGTVLSMREDFREALFGRYNIEVAVCFVTSMTLLYFLFSQPDTDLMKAVVNNDREAVQLLIAQSKNVDERGQCRVTQSFYTTPPIEAAKLGRTEIAITLLDAGANIDARDEFGTTPLVAALSGGHVNLAGLLLEKGADPNLATCRGHGSCTTALRCARRTGNAQLIEEIVTLGGREQTEFLFSLECFWINGRPILLFAATRIVPIVCLVMLFGGLLRRRFGGNGQ